MRDIRPALPVLTQYNHARNASQVESTTNQVDQQLDNCRQIINTNGKKNGSICIEMNKIVAMTSLVRGRKGQQKRGKRKTSKRKQSTMLWSKVQKVYTEEEDGDGDWKEMRKRRKVQKKRMSKKKKEWFDTDSWEEGEEEEEEEEEEENMKERSDSKTISTKTFTTKKTSMSTSSVTTSALQTEIDHQIHRKQWNGENNNNANRSSMDDCTWIDYSKPSTAQTCITSTNISEGQGQGQKVREIVKAL